MAFFFLFSTGQAWAQSCSSSDNPSQTGICAASFSGCPTGATPASTNNCGAGICCIGGSSSGTPGGSSSGTASGVCPDSSMTKIAGVCVPTSSSTGLSDKPVTDLLVTFMNWLLGIFGVLAIIGFIISGLQYLFSSGDEHMIETAKRNMKYCIIGIVVALAAFVIIQAIDALLNASPVF